MLASSRLSVLKSPLRASGGGIGPVLAAQVNILAKQINARRRIDRLGVRIPDPFDQRRVEGVIHLHDLWRTQMI